MADLRLGRRIVYDVKANWKLTRPQLQRVPATVRTFIQRLNRLHHYPRRGQREPTACYCGGAMGFREGVETMSMGRQIGGGRE
jgi:hypothetical protein